MATKTLFERGSWSEVRRIGDVLRAETVGGVLPWPPGGWCTSPACTPPSRECCWPSSFRSAAGRRGRGQGLPSISSTGSAEEQLDADADGVPDVYQRDGLQP